MSTLALKQHQIPFFKPAIDEEDIASVVDTLRSGWLTTGPKVKQFEAGIAERVGAGHAVAVSSCTAALHLALEAIGIGPGDEVIIPAMTFASTGEVIQHLGGRPVLVDVRPDTLLLDPGLIEAKITSRTKAVIPVHYGGQPCEMDKIMDIAARRGLKVIEDAAHAYPASYEGRPVGGIGHATCFSFYANKTLTTGEGGMITTNDEQLAQRARLMSLHGINRDAWKRFSADGTWDYEIVAPGFKSNLTDIAAAIGLVQLQKSEELLRRRQAIAARYDEMFRECEGLLDIPVTEPNRTTAWHLYVIRLRHEALTIDRNRLIQELAAAGIGTSVHYRPLHLHPWYVNQYGCRPEDLPVATDAFQRIVSLPLYPRMTEQDIETVGETVVRLLTSHQR